MHDDSVRRADCLIGLFDRPVVGFEICGPVSLDWLHPAEAHSVARAVDKRQREFAGGRNCARRALAELGAPDGPLLVGDKRAPVWPPGCVGSITHTKGYCGAVACSVGSYAGIGIDVEVRGSVRRDLEPRICTDPERLWLDGLESRQRADMTSLLFSAKEAFYKCQFCVTRSWLDFHDVRLEVGCGTFRVEVHKCLPALAGRADSLEGRFSISGAHIFTGIGIPAGP